MLVREALNHIRAVVIEQGAFDPFSSARHFRIILSDYMATTLYHELLGEVADLAPGIAFGLLGFDDDFDGPLNRGEVAFLFFPDVFLSDRHPSRALFDEEMAAVRYARSAGGPLTMAGYFSATPVAARFGTTTKPAIEEFLMSELSLRRRIEIAGVELYLDRPFRGRDPARRNNASSPCRTTGRRHGAAYRTAAFRPAKSPGTVAMAAAEPIQSNPASVWLRERVLSRVDRFVPDGGEERGPERSA